MQPCTATRLAMLQTCSACLHTDVVVRHCSAICWHSNAWADICRVCPVCCCVSCCCCRYSFGIMSECTHSALLLSQQLRMCKVTCSCNLPASSSYACCNASAYNAQLACIACFFPCSDLAAAVMQCLRNAQMPSVVWCMQGSDLCSLLLLLLLLCTFLQCGRCTPTSRHIKACTTVQS
jgi:hypothetical protein